ncbi:MAG TPA: hypothetical protein VF119_08880 [Candidatus Limnocylindrales bacterium]
MSVHLGRAVASLALLVGGFVVGVAVLAVVFASVLVGAGMTITPSEAALLDDLVGVLPFIAGFALLSVIAGAGLIAGSETAETMAVGTSVVAVIVGLVGLTLTVVGRDPFAGAGSTADGVGVVGAFTFTYAAALVALVAARTGSTTQTSQAVLS